MSLAGLAGLLILLVAAWIGGSYVGIRRATRARSREFVARQPG